MLLRCEGQRRPERSQFARHLPALQLAGRQIVDGANDRFVGQGRNALAGHDGLVFSRWRSLRRLPHFLRQTEGDDAAGYSCLVRLHASAPEDGGTVSRQSDLELWLA